MAQHGTWWEIAIRAKPGRVDPEESRVARELESWQPILQSRFDANPPRFLFERGFLLSGSLERHELERLARKLFVDEVLEDAHVIPLNETRLAPATLTVLLKPGVMDPVALTAAEAILRLGESVSGVRTFRRYLFDEWTPEPAIALLVKKVLANDAIEQAILGPIDSTRLGAAGDYDLVKITVPMLSLGDDELVKLSKEGGLYLNLDEMQAIRNHFKSLGRNPTDIELETLAQTWSEHCSHKTFRGPYEHNGVRGKSGLLKDTIMHATRELNRDWCVSVFEDNAGVVRFDDHWNVCFKVETHNHPSAIEPYGGANTGLGGVIRDPMGTGMGAKPICNTDVFCFAPPDTPHDSLPEGVLPPERVLRGVVSGVRDYGNRMGIPTVNGAVCFDSRYLGNPLVYCGTVGLIPRHKTAKRVQPGDLIVALGGRTGRDGIHGATFSSAELTTDSETVSGGAVQIGNAIAEKKLLDVILKARDHGLYHAITDCGAGGFSSAVGEMGAELGARVNLDQAKLKYQGLSYTEIWISESQERMVLAVPTTHWQELKSLAESEDVEAFILGQFEATGKLQLFYQDQPVGELSMRFLHDGRPAVLKRGEFPKSIAQPLTLLDRVVDPALTLLKILGSLNVASKEWIIRQYDHEVQGGSVVKPLVGIAEDGPSDAAVVAPVLGSTRGLAIGCGINPRFGDLDPYRMAASAIDEALRNVVAVGGDPDRTAILDNFCWGNTDRPEVFGSLCEAAFGCRDTALAFGTPFISGKDSLYNEFNTGSERIVIPPTLLISAMAIVPDVRQCVTMDLKEAGNYLLLVGLTLNEMGGSHFALVTEATGGEVPGVDTGNARTVFAAIHQILSAGRVRACHDLSEGGLAVAVAEMAFAGGLGVNLDLACVPVEGDLDATVRLFAESNTRFLLEVEPRHLDGVRTALGSLPHGVVGEICSDQRLKIADIDNRTIVDLSLSELKSAWQKPLAFG